MKDLTNYKSTSDNHYIFFDLKDVKFSLSELFGYFFKDFIERFNFIGDFDETLRRCLHIIESEPHNVMPRDLFEYCTYGVNGNPYLVAKDGVYTEKWLPSWQGGGLKKTYYDVYLTQHSCASVHLNYMAERLFFMAFPTLRTLPVFNVVENAYPECVKKITRNTPIKELDKILNYQFDFESKLTVGDLVKLVADPSLMEQKVPKSLFTIYADGNIFLTLTPDYKTGDVKHKCLNLRAEDFIERDWKAVIRRHNHYGKNGKELNNADVLAYGSHIVDVFRSVIFNPDECVSPK